MMQRFDEQGSALGIIEQIVLQVGIALDDPDVTQYLVQHPRRSARSALRTEFIDDLPTLFAEQTQDDLAVGE
jgi:hypothetical protein